MHLNYRVLEFKKCESFSTANNLKLIEKKIDDRNQR
jgi:hypothetical protein